MKRNLIIIFFLTFNFISAQSNQEIANVYITRAYDAIASDLDMEKAFLMFGKAMRYTDTIKNKKVASLGVQVYYELHHRQPTIKEQLSYLEKAKSYSAQFFLLAKNKKSEEYQSSTDYHVSILEDIEKLKEKLKKQEEEQLRKEKEIRRIDSLKTLWQNKSKSLSIQVDSIYAFNKNNIALYQKNSFFGIINDVGEVLLEANEYKEAIAFDGYVIFKNKIIDPTKLYCFNTNTKIGFLIPSISDFNTLSTHYGVVMFPRGNGRLVTYPNNAKKPFIYDLNLRKEILITTDMQELFKRLKKADIIDKYNKENEIKIGKTWFNFGGHLGGGIYPLYAVEGFRLSGFLCSLDGRILNAIADYQNIGIFYDNKYQALKGTDVLWINQNGTKVSASVDESGTYSGTSIVSKLDDGSYQIKQDGIIILGNEKLEKMDDFLRSFSSN